MAPGSGGIKEKSWSDRGYRGTAARVDGWLTAAISALKMPVYVYAATGPAGEPILLLIQLLAVVPKDLAAFVRTDGSSYIN